MNLYTKALLYSYVDAHSTILFLHYFFFSIEIEFIPFHPPLSSIHILFILFPPFFKLPYCPSQIHPHIDYLKVSV